MILIIIEKLKQYIIKTELFKFSGRIGRKKYSLFLIPFSVYEVLIDLLYSNRNLLMIIISYLLFFQLLTITSRRLHDLGVSGFWQIWLLLIPPSLISLCFFKGTIGSNKYGDPPLL